MNQAKSNPNLKIKLDTNLKEITVEGNPNLNELFKGLEKLLPKDSPFGSWKNYTINTNTAICSYPYWIYTGNPYWWNSYQSSTPNLYVNTVIDTTPITYTLGNNSSSTEGANFTQFNQEQGIYYIQL